MLVARAVCGLVGTLQVVLPAKYEVAKSGQIGFLALPEYNLPGCIPGNQMTLNFLECLMSSLLMVYDGLFSGSPREPGSECECNAVRAQVIFVEATPFAFHKPPRPSSPPTFSVKQQKLTIAVREKWLVSHCFKCELYRVVFASTNCRLMRRIRLWWNRLCIACCSRGPKAKVDVVYWI